MRVTEHNFKVAVGLITKGVNNLSVPRMCADRADGRTFLTEHGVLYDVIYLPKWIHDNIDYIYIVSDPIIADKAIDIATRYRIVDLDKGQPGRRRL